jgi:hypothetical protein
VYQRRDVGEEGMKGEGKQRKKIETGKNVYV